jgi:hypothetical protein
MSQLQHLRVNSRSVSLDVDDLDRASEHWPALGHLHIQGPLRQASPSPSPIREGTLGPAWELPPRLRVLELRNTRLRPHAAAAPAVRLTTLPGELLVLALEGVDLVVLQAGHSSSQAGAAAPEDSANAAKAVRIGRGPAMVVLRAARCELRCALELVCGPALRHLDLDALAASAAAGHGPGCSFAMSLRDCNQIRRLRLHGCTGQLRPFNDAGLQELITNQHPHMREVVLNASAATKTGLAILKRLTYLRSLEIAVSGQECAAVLGEALASARWLRHLKVLVPTLNFMGDCVRDHLAHILPSAQVQLITQRVSD